MKDFLLLLQGLLNIFPAKKSMKENQHKPKYVCMKEI
jgi:hypothetical protein